MITQKTAQLNQRVAAAVILHAGAVKTGEVGTITEVREDGVQITWPHVHAPLFYTYGNENLRFIEALERNDP